MAIGPIGIDIDRIRADARLRVESGSVTGDYSADLGRLIALLRQSMAAEIVCFLRYTQHAFAANGLRAEDVAREFREHAAAELGHAQNLARRVVQLGGEPDLSPTALLASHATFSAGGDLEKMIVENLVEERVAIDWYRAAVAFVGDDDPTTRRLFEGILADEEEHADDLAGFIREHGS